MKSKSYEFCPDCGAGFGQLHSAGCDVEPCPYCGHQLLSCFCDGLGIGGVPADDRIPWTGTWPGVMECREFGWFAMPEPGKGWVPCSADEPDAMVRKRAGTAGKSDGSRRIDDWSGLNNALSIRSRPQPF